MPGDPDIVQIKANGRVLSEATARDLLFIRVEQSVTLPDRFDIHLNDPFFEHLDSRLFKIGTEVEVSVRGGGKLTSLTKGYVTSVSSEVGQNVDRLVISGFDASFKMTLEPRSRTFLKMSASDIVKKVAGDHGLSAQVKAAPFKYEHMLQHNETDYEFLQRLANLVGYRFWVSEKKLHFDESLTGNVTAVLDMGDDLVRINFRMTAADRADTAEASFWDPSQKKALTAKVTSASNSNYVENRLLNEVEKDASKAFKKVTTRTGHAPLQTNEEAKALAEGHLRTASAGQVILKGEAIGSPLITAGSKVKIIGGGKTVSGEYMVTSAEHIYGGGLNYTTRFTAGEREPARLVDLLGGTRQSPGNEYSPWGQVRSAVVTNLNDPEKLGRIKVKYGTLESEEESDWARIMAPGAGKESGFQAMPDVNDEVLVGFEFGNPANPIILGGLWNGKDKPPADLADYFKNGAVIKRTWRSRSGQAIELHDGEKGSGQKIVIVDGSTKSTVSLEDKGIFIKTTDASKKVTVDSAGDVEVESKKNVSIKGQKVTVEGSAGLELKGAKIDIKASGNVTIKGAVIQLN